MPPEDSTAIAGPPVPANDARAARALWRELGAAYDAIEHCLVSVAWDDVAPLAARVAALQSALEPTLAAPHAPEDATIWAEVEALAAALATRQAFALRAATAARDAIAARLARAHRSRTGAANYRGVRPEQPLFASRRA
jgi:hypothetical protein